MSFLMGDEDDVAENTGDILPPTGVGVILHSRSPEAETGKEAMSVTLILTHNLAFSALFSQETSHAWPFLLP
jgi:hypothetical protein